MFTAAQLIGRNSKFSEVEKMEGEKVLGQEEEASPPNKKLKASQKSNGNEIAEFSGAGELNAVPVKLEGYKAKSNSDESIHPLLVDHILDKIFKLIIDPIREKGKHKPDVEAISRDVQNFRLVCKTWRDFATNVFRKARSMMNIGGEEIMEGPDLQLGRFLDTMKGTHMIPVQRYRIHRSVLTPQNSQLMKLFLEICGPETVEIHLAISGSDVNSSFNIPGDGSHLTLDKLSTVILHMNYGHGPSEQKSKDREYRDVAHFIGFLFSIANHLKNFTMTYHGLCGGVFEGIEKFFEKIPTSLKSIKLYTTNYWNFCMKILQMKQLELETFAFHFYGEQIFPSWVEELYGFFEEQSKTLKILSVPTVCLTVQPESKNPIVYGQLNSLVAQRRQLPISFPDRFPKLTILDLSNVTHEPNCMKLLSVTAPSETVTELHLPYISLGADIVMKSAECFPKVQNLYIGLSSQLTGVNPFHNVFIYFPNIEELVISLECDNKRLDECGESFLCSICSDHCESALLRRNLDDFDFKMIGETPCILLFKKLRKLTLKDCHDVKFTDFAAHFFFLKMESLEELYIDSGFGRMSADYVTRLKNKLKILGD